MLISEAIVKLQELKEKFGDCQIIVVDYQMFYADFRPAEGYDFSIKPGTFIEISHGEQVATE